MRVWVDLTNSPHVPIFVPLIRRMQARGWDVAVSARRFAQTIELMKMLIAGARSRDDGGRPVQIDDVTI